MTDQAAQFEQVDLLGSTVPLSASVGTSLTAIPAAATTIIQTFIVICKVDQVPATKRLLVSLDGGTNFTTLKVGGRFGGRLKGNKKQIHIKGNQAGVEYEITLNKELT